MFGTARRLSHQSSPHDLKRPEQRCDIRGARFSRNPLGTYQICTGSGQRFPAEALHVTGQVIFFEVSGFGLLADDIEIATLRRFQVSSL
jgi:hypothetical protein